MNKFTSNLTQTNKDLVKSRAQLIADQVKVEQETLVQNFRKETNNLRLELARMSDVGPNTDFDLRPGKDINAEQWVTRHQELQVQLAEKSVELEIAEKTLAEWFTNEAPAEGEDA